LKQDAAAEAQRLAIARSFTRSDDEGARMLVESDGPWIIRARRSALRASLGHRILLLWRLGYEDACGHVVESVCVPTVVCLGQLPRVRDRAWIEDVLRGIERDIHSLIDASTASQRDAVERIRQACTSTRLTRERAIAAQREATIGGAFQPGLFDRRAERSRLAAIAERQLADRDQSNRVERLTLNAVALPAAPRLLLIVVP
jgi:hypothetical protein